MSIRNQFGVKRKLGQALYGDVWLCEDAARNRALVAIKEVSLREAKRALSLNRHMDNPWQERKITQLLSQLGRHPHILQHHDDFMENGSWFSVMEYCNGGDLLAHLQDLEDGRMVESVALNFFRQIADGLRFLHQHGIAHRDLSLENVLLHNRTCKLSDFGLSIESDRMCQERVGKAYYMAPEVVANEAYDPAAADIWSLGMILFIMLTGSPLVQMASAQDKGFMALQTFGVKKIVDAWGMSASITPLAIDLLSRMLDMNPAKRPTVVQLLEHPALERLLAEL